MSESIPYPQSTVWFVQAGGPGGNEGSAVAVRLRKKDGRGSFQNYLITCAHVVRQIGAGERQLGPVHQTLRAWHPGDPYTDNSAYLVELCKDLVPVESSEPESFYDMSIEDIVNCDFALLKFEDQVKCNDHSLEVVRSWAQDVPRNGGECSIYGYKGGSAAFAPDQRIKNGIVKPSEPYERPRIEESGQGLIRLAGSCSKPGMSGGGVFATIDDVATFIGMHRERTPATDEMHEISSVQIRGILRDYVFHFEDHPDSSVGADTRLSDVIDELWKELIECKSLDDLNRSLDHVTIALERQPSSPELRNLQRKVLEAIQKETRVGVAREIVHYRSGPRSQESKLNPRLVFATVLLSVAAIAFLVFPYINPLYPPVGAPQPVAIDPATARVAEPSQANRQLNDKIDEWLLRRSEGGFSVVLIVESTEFGDKVGSPTIEVVSEIQNAQLEVVAVIVRPSASEPIPLPKVTPTGLTDQPIRIDVDNSSPLKRGDRLLMLVGAKIPTTDTAIGQTESEVAKSLILRTL